MTLYMSKERLFRKPCSVSVAILATHRERTQALVREAKQKTTACIHAAASLYVCLYVCLFTIASHCPVLDRFLVDHFCWEIDTAGVRMCVCIVKTLKILFAPFFTIHRVCEFPGLLADCLLPARWSIFSTTS